MILEGVWQYETGVVPPPGVGGMRTPADDSVLWLHRIDDSGFDRSIEFGAAPEPPFDILVRDANGHNRRWQVTSVSNEGDYAEASVAYLSGSTEPLTKNVLVLVQWETADQIGGVTPTPPEDEARLTQAVIAKATRILSLVESPLGLWGEMTDLGPASVKPDWQIRELLFGLHYSGMPVPEVSADMVIRQGLQTDPAGFPTANLPDVERAIAAARSWIAHDLQGFGIA